MGLNLNYTADVLVSTEDMQEETWLQYRRNGIGGSDAAAVIGLSPYKTARDVYFEKLGREPEDNNTSGWVAMEVGKRGFSSCYFCEENRFSYLAGEGDVPTSVIPVYAGGRRLLF